MIEDADRCYLAVQSRDPRFDGRFFTAVTSTGIYCRPSCPARTPMRSNVRFYPSAAAAQAAGFRACKRCRPGATPGSPEWDTRADVVARAMRLIGDGLVDRVGVPGLAARLGYSVRHLERLLSSELGAGPIALARAGSADQLTGPVLRAGSADSAADKSYGMSMYVRATVTACPAMTTRSPARRIRTMPPREDACSPTSTSRPSRSPQ